jgi:hypothetical protein
VLFGSAGLLAVPARRAYLQLLSSRAMTTQAFSAIDAAAVRAHSHTESSVQFLIDTLFERLVRDIPAGHSVRRRVTRTEIAFHIGLSGTITEHRLAQSINSAVTRERLPDEIRTNPPLIHEYRSRLRPHIPNLIGNTSTPDALTDEMSPAESVCLALCVGSDLLHRYRGPHAPLEKRSEPVFAPGAKAKLVIRSFDDTYRRAFAADVSREDSHTSRALHRFLDGLGFHSAG